MRLYIYKRKPERKWKSGKKRRFVTLVFFSSSSFFFLFISFSILCIPYYVDIVCIPWSDFLFRKLLEQMQNTFFPPRSPCVCVCVPHLFDTKMENICCKRKINFIFMRNKHKNSFVIFVDFWCFVSGVSLLLVVFFLQRCFCTIFTLMSTHYNHTINAFLCVRTEMCFNGIFY